MAKNPYPEPYDRGLWKRFLEEAGKPLNDYMVAIDSTTGKVVAVWEGTTKRGSLGDTVIQYAVGKQSSRDRARQAARYRFRQRSPGE